MSKVTLFYVSAIYFIAKIIYLWLNYFGAIKGMDPNPFILVFSLVIAILIPLSKVSEFIANRYSVPYGVLPKNLFVLMYLLVAHFAISLLFLLLMLF